MNYACACPLAIDDSPVWYALSRVRKGFFCAFSKENAVFATISVVVFEIISLHTPAMAATRMTKTQLQATLAETVGTDKKTAGVFLTALVDIAYRETKKKGEFVIPGIGKLVKQKRKARTGINPKTGEKIKIAAKTVVKLRVAKAAKDAVLAAK